jgi:hypothetical protein
LLTDTAARIDARAGDCIKRGTKRLVVAIQNDDGRIAWESSVSLGDPLSSCCR